MGLYTSKGRERKGGGEEREGEEEGRG